MRSAAILAGGQASRFGGRDKSALVVEGRTILERQIAELLEVDRLEEILVVGRRSHLERWPRARAVEDVVPGAGPLGGIHTALTEARGAAVFVAGCDMPFISARLVEHLFELSRDADLVLPRTERGYHPLCAVYTRACLEPVARRLAERRLKVLDLADDVRTRVVSSDEVDMFGDRHRLLANVNTPAEYEGLEAFHGHEL
jgi:molybdopterin-guanine dinucleotide biosynthesis protein A